MITNGYYYIDKTLLIKELLDLKSMVTLFTRPRRFGKTLSIDMLREFFEIKRVQEPESGQINNARLFSGLRIMDTGEEYLQHMGQYPVISLTLKSAKQDTFDLSMESIINAISWEYKRHKYILENEELGDMKEQYLRIMAKTGKMSDYNSSLEFLSQCLELYHKKKVIILIDEYDVPLENSYFRMFYDHMISFIRSLFESALKTNHSLEFAVLTGCLRISKESIFTGLNNPKIVSILDVSYSEHFGFTQDEVREIIKHYELEKKERIIKKWYDGYLFGNTAIYNPWSIIRATEDLHVNPKGIPKAYWGNTSSNEIIKTLIKFSDMSTKNEIETLMAGKSIEKRIHEDITYDEMEKSAESLWNFLFFTGYLTKTRERSDAGGSLFLKMKIPNTEVLYIYKNKIIEWFNEQVKIRDLSKIYDAIINGDAESLGLNLSIFLGGTISYEDYYENFYHGVFLGVLSGMSGYIVKSNRESGMGRSDIIVRNPIIQNGDAYIFELKTLKKIKDLEKDL
jgi:hypothetical protein